MSKIPRNPTNDPIGGISQSRADIGELIQEIQRAEGISPDAASYRFSFLGSDPDRRRTIISSSTRTQIEESLKGLSQQSNLVAAWARFVDGLQDGTASAVELIDLHNSLIKEEVGQNDPLFAQEEESPPRKFIDYYGTADPSNDLNSNLLYSALYEG